ncbi:MAG: hypothetical protein AAGF92_13095 [Myxococcota bacterium]
MAFLLMAVLISGCVPKRSIQHWTPPQTLSAVNAELRGKVERIYLTDGTVIRFARNIEVRPDSVVWKDYNTDQHKAVSVDSVDYIRATPRYPADRATKKRRTGIGIGGVVGLAGGTVYAVARPRDTCLLICGIEILADVVLVHAAVWGAQAVAALVVLQPRLPKPQVVYRGPIEPYLQAEAAARRNP